MRKVLFYHILCMISIVLHAFNEVIWEESSHLEEWYTFQDLCVLKNNSNSHSDLIHEYCEQKAIEAGYKTIPIRCRVGNSWPSKSGYCAADDIPYIERATLRYSLRGYDDPHQKPLQKLFDRLKIEKGVLLLVGDSVMQQFYSAMACELEREEIWRDPNQFKNTDEIKYVDHVPIKFVPIYHLVNSRWDRIANAAMHSLRKVIDGFLYDHESLTIFVNMGLHFVSNPVQHFSRDDYRSQMTTLLTYLNELTTTTSKKIRIIWRETSAQHFPTLNGYWPGQRYAANMKLSCSPINDTSSEADWRNRDIAELVRNQNLSTIRILPYYNVTIPLWSLHVNGHMRDCTHFCWTPIAISIFISFTSGDHREVNSYNSRIMR